MQSNKFQKKESNRLKIDWSRNAVQRIPLDKPEDR